MIEELTPQVLMTSMALIIVTSSLLTFLLCALLLWMFRRAVTRAMTAVSGFHSSAEEETTATSPDISNSYSEHQTIEASSDELYHHTIRAPWHDAMLYAVAMLVAALFFAEAAQNNYSFNLGLPGFLVGVWIYAWPVILALPLIVPGSIQLWIACIIGCVVGYALLGLWASTITNIPGIHIGGINLPARSSVTPFNMTSLWLSANALPTVLTILCFHRRVRAVAPLVLALVTLVITGVWFALILSSGPAGKSALSWLGGLDDTYSVWLMLAIFALFLSGLVAIGWALARWIARAYQQRRISDRSLILDALWLVFACMYSMWLVTGGVGWIAIVPGGFLVYKLILAIGAKIRNGQPKTSRGLTFLRVFSLGRRSEALLEGIAKYWRHIGSVQMIAGPDVAGSTVQPHQFLDFLSGKLSRHFIGDRASLKRSLADRDFDPDPDGRFRVNSLFFHEDSWQPALPRLVQEGDTILMDLRSFSASNAGCLHELRFLAAHVPFNRCVFVIDDTTDEGYLKETLRETGEQLSPSSPNYGQTFDRVPVERFGSGTTSVQQLVKRMCDAARRE